jgi:hypothetical protein
MPEFGSLVNMIQGNAQSVDPEIGMGVTFLSWSDRHPGTIQQINVKNGKIVSLEVTMDGANRTDNYGMSDAQSYEYIPDPNGFRIIVKQDRNGVWRKAHVTETGQMRVNKNCQRVLVGRREKFYDYSF